VAGMPRRVRAVVAVSLALLAVLAPSAAAGPVAEATDEAPAIAAAPLATPLLSARRVPDLLRASVADDRMRAAIEPLLASAPADSCVVVSNGGRVIVDRNGDQPKAPASTAKLLTAAAILAEFPSQQRLVTRAAAAAGPRDGVIDGDLFLIGGGDPILTTPGYRPTFENPDQLANDFAPLADRIASAGVREIRGDVVGDESRYDLERWIPTWPERYRREGYIGPLGALMVNDGNTGYSRDPDGAAPNRAAGEPAALAAETLRTMLVGRGVRVTGGVRTGAAPADAVDVASLESPPMEALVDEMIGDSDNTTAELLAKELGRQRSGEGTTAAGTAAIEQVLTDRGLPTEGLHLLDASGLDPDSRLTCRLLVEALDEEGPDSALAARLPVAGETGTLRRRMRGTPAEGRVAAKTGTLNEVNALTGFATTLAGSTLTFAYLVNGPEQPLGYQVIDDFMAALIGVPDGPSVDELSPLAPGA
jgi:D-alanyl-D-alanine carboxypeptidase/D-alanyl-D-alanine-endopeptidase (penicillin-binding protein 4)